MEFSTQTSVSLHQIKTTALAVGVFADGVLSAAAEVLDRASEGAISAVIKQEFKAKTNTHLVLRSLSGIKAERVILVGLGPQEEYKTKQHKEAETQFALYCQQSEVTDAVSALASTHIDASTLRERCRNAAFSVTQSLYRYTATLSKPKPEAKLKKWSSWVPRTQQTEAREGLAEGQAMGAGSNLTRTLADLPPNVCTPSYLAKTAKELAKEFKTLKVEVLERKQLEALKMNSFLSVARGSDEPPVFIVLKYSPASQAKNKKAADQSGPIVLVGKGLTFDSGGISIKPSANMDEMKYDMGGGASVLGTMRAIAELSPEREVIGVVAACENMPSGKANKPGDVVTSMSGQTIEILNTDAEGRLVLCDALTYVERFKPAMVVDIATLTGACVVALGHVNSGLFSQDEELAAALLSAGRQTGDTAWRMPLEEAYQEQLRSNFADMANIGGMPGGSVTAACFLARFTKAYRWAHLDVAGTAWRSGKDKGATGRPVPLLTQFILDQTK